MLIKKRFEWDMPLDYRSKYAFNTKSVYSLTAYEFWLAMSDDQLTNIWASCDIESKRNPFEKPDEKNQKILNSPIDMLLHDPYDRLTEQHLCVDLAATDEQIISDFRHWLIEYRKAITYESRKKAFTDKDLLDWFQWRLLPYIDLRLAAKIDKFELKQSKAANTIFSDECEVDVVDRLRRTTIPKAEWLLKDETINAINLQARA